MPSFKLDGRQIPFEPGDTIIRAAWRQGIEIPHYCWHPGLSVAANCRMCLVEIVAEKPMLLPVLAWDDKSQDYVAATKPKLQPACQMPATEGMEVLSQSPQVKAAQASVQEFLLLNHPVDCPICDQAGECKLQDYWLAHQGKHKRKLSEPVHKPKGVRFGPTIVYDAERCIVCTRCIRVCDELAGDHVLDMRQRGNKAEIVLAPGRELDHQYSLMTEHVCPVGALTSRDFRFKARVWFLKSASGVCSGCATGCNTHVDYDPRDQKVVRLRPRDNLEVNKFWMCDDGMMTYRQVHEDRVFAAHRGRDGARTTVTTKEALSEAARILRAAQGKVAVVFSAQHATEDNVALARLAKDALGSDRFYLAALGGWKGDAILRNADNNPNRAGATKAAGGAPKKVADLVRDVQAGTVEAVLVLGSLTAETAAELAPLAGRNVICLASNQGPLSRVASVVIPVASWAEMDGTFVNAKGRAQQFRRAVSAPGIRPAWECLAALAKELGRDLGLRTVNDVRASMGAANSPAPAEVRAP